MMKSRWLLIVLLSLCAPLAFSAGDIKAGESKTTTCVACHGPDGNSSAPMWPKLAGQHEKYLVKQLKDYRKGETGPRYEPQMYAMSAALSDQDIEDLSAYYASLKQTIGKTPKDALPLGERIYRGGILDKGVAACTACHGPEGLGNGLAGYPRMGGQNADYNVLQLKAFQNGTRRNDTNSIMRDIAQRMNDQEMKAVSEYMAGLHK
jgi:cytochrome c553